MNGSEQPLLTFFSSIGVSGITALVVYLWMKKDKQYTDLADRVTGAFEQHAKTNTELKTVVESNTRVVEKLQDTITTQLFEVLKGNNRK